MTAKWHDVGPPDDLNEDQPITVKAAGREIGIYVLDGKHYALEDVCPHAFALLSQGFIMDGEVECPLHGARWDIATGALKAEPGGRDLKCYPCKVEGGRVLVEVPES
ncbi:MAG: non-heme iron oxygenase ferredoxin subunit [Betaproteobacteria bacterium]|nr:non-heme iron oxygenase ferredoxin subunit [Betaproteobacteria bacterium]